MRVVTTFAARHWTDGLAKEMVETFLKYWEGFELWVYVNGGIPPDLAANPGVVVIDHYKHDGRLREFIDKYQKVTQPLVWYGGRYEYKWDACRFAHKVFALSDASQRPGVHGDLIWLDADVVSHAAVTPTDLRKLWGRFDDVAYLGREGFSPECGFLYFNLNRMGAYPVADMVRFYRDYGDSPPIFDEPEWHDGYLFGKAIPNYANTNLSAGIKGKHVWPESPLGKFCSHLKGPARKRARRDLPDAEALAIPDQVTEEV